MAVNPTDVRVLRYNQGRAFKAPIGATAMRPGSLAKFDTNVLVPLADNDENLAAYAILEQADAANTDPGVLVVPFADAVLELGYTGGTPTVGTSYGVTGPQTVDVANTTQLLVTVVAVNTARTTVDVIMYQVAA